MKRALRISIILLLLFSICDNAFAAKRIDYYSVSDIIKDSRYASGRVAMIKQLEIVDEMKPKRTYMARDEAGHKLILNLVGKISISPEFAKVKRLKVGTVYAIFFKINGISRDGIVNGNVEAIGFPSEIPASVAKGQKGPEVSRPDIFEEKQTIEQKEIAPEVSVREPEQSKPMEPFEKRGPESKVAELVKPVIPSSQTERKMEPPLVEPHPSDKIQAKPQISEPTPPIEKKTDPSQSRKAEPSITIEKSAARTGSKTVQEGRKTSEAQGSWMEVIIYLLPLIIGACVSGLTYGAKTDVLVKGVSKFDAWVIRKRNDLKSQEGKGKIKRYWAMPILWILNGIIELSEKIQNEAIRCGVKTSAFLYLLGIVIMVTFYAVLLIISIIIAILIIAIIGWILSLQEGAKEKPIPEHYAYPHDEEEKKSKWPWKDKRVVIDEKAVREKTCLGESKVGHVEKGEIHKEGIIFSEKVGKVKEGFLGGPKAIVDKDGEEVGKIKETWLGDKIIVDEDGKVIGEYKDKK